MTRLVARKVTRKGYYVTDVFCSRRRQYSKRLARGRSSSKLVKFVHYRRKGEHCVAVLAKSVR